MTPTETFDLTGWPFDPTVDFGTDDVGAETTQRACRVYGSFELRLITFLKKKGPLDRISTSFNPMWMSRQLVHTFRQYGFWVEDLSSYDTFQREKTLRSVPFVDARLNVRWISSFFSLTEVVPLSILDGCVLLDILLELAQVGTQNLINLGFDEHEQWDSIGQLEMVSCFFVDIYVNFQEHHFFFFLGNDQMKYCILASMTKQMKLKLFVSLLNFIVFYSRVRFLRSVIFFSP